MSTQRLQILSVSQLPASPPRFGAQARMHGLLSELGRRHDVTAVVLLDPDFDAEECGAAMRAYCREVVLVPNPRGGDGSAKRLLQLRSMVSARSFERLRVSVPEFRRSLDSLLRARRFDVVALEATFLGNADLRQAPPGERPPLVFIDAHNIDYDLARQYARISGSWVRRLYAGVNWRKLRREELATYAAADGVYLCSAADEQRLLGDVAGARTCVIPNAADVTYFQPRATDPAPDGHTIVFFGLLSYLPNIDGITHFIERAWPRIAAGRPDVRFKIIGGRPPPALQALAGDRIELTGFVDDLRPHLAGASVVVVPLRLGGGTRLKIVEAMAMAKPIVSTALGAEGIEAADGRDILLRDDPSAFADAVLELLAHPERAMRMGQAARRLAVARYSWTGAALALENFYRQDPATGTIAVAAE